MTDAKCEPAMTDDVGIIRVWGPFIHKVSRIQFDIVDLCGHVIKRLVLDYQAGELSEQYFSCEGKVTSSIGIYLTENEKKRNTAAFERS